MIAQLMGRRYDEETYHCVHFVVDVWKELTGVDLSEQFRPILEAPESRSATSTVWSGFREVQAPEEPCLVLLRAQGRQPHLGIYVDGGVLHLREKGAMRQQLLQLRFEYPEARFFACES
jgi:hypothetical protein